VNHGKKLWKEKMVRTGTLLLSVAGFSVIGVWFCRHIAITFIMKMVAGCLSEIFGASLPTYRES
jgi:hypothetical protein